MPSDPLILTYLDDLVDTLATMSRANGYHFDYGQVEEDKDIDFDGAADLERPPISVAWAGEAEQESIYGGETAANRFRHYERIQIGVPIKDEDGFHSRKAFRVRADIHAALMAGTSRARGSEGRAGTTDTLSAYSGNQDGGVLIVTYHIRWDHVLGDHSTQ